MQPLQVAVSSTRPVRDGSRTLEHLLRLLAQLLHVLAVDDSGDGLIKAWLEVLLELGKCLLRNLDAAAVSANALWFSTPCSSRTVRAPP